MIFCQYNYKNYHNQNTNCHPLQPYSWENWCQMIKENHLYCNKFNWYKWLVFYFWIFVGRVKYSDLPSFHPYWRLDFKKSSRKQLKQLIKKYKDCVKNPERIKFHFNAQTTLKTIEAEINLRRKILKNY